MRASAGGGRAGAPCWRSPSPAAAAARPATSTPGGCRSLEIVVDHLDPGGRRLPGGRRGRRGRGAHAHRRRPALLPGLGLPGGGPAGGRSGGGERPGPGGEPGRCDRGRGRRRGHRGGGGIVRGHAPLRRGGRRREPSEPGDLDPHFWTDPRRMAEVAAGLGGGAGRRRPGLRRRAARRAPRPIGGELLDLDAEIERMLAGIPAEQRKLVTNHRTLGYFAERYGFEVVGAIIPGGSHAAPSPALPTWPLWPNPAPGRGAGHLHREHPAGRPGRGAGRPNWASRSRWWACTPSPWARPGPGRRPTSACSESTPSASPPPWGARDGAGAYR